MTIPKFLMGDNTDHPDDIFVIHTEFPRFIINLVNDQLEWLEEFEAADEKELEAETANCIREAAAFYDREVSRYEDA